MEQGSYLFTSKSSPLSEWKFLRGTNHLKHIRRSLLLEWDEGQKAQESGRSSWPVPTLNLALTLCLAGPEDSR